MKLNKIAYLTIDDAPSPDFRRKVDFLYAGKIPVTWFCEGKKLENNMENTVYAIRKSQIIGNHAWDHKPFSELSLAECRKQIKRTDDVIDKVYVSAGIRRPAKFFRFPYGDKGGNLSRADYENEVPYGKAGQAKKEGIQAYLRELGYSLPPFKDINYGYVRAAGWSEDVDWQWTYDCFEYSITHKRKHFGIDSIEKVLA